MTQRSRIITTLIAGALISSTAIGAVEVDRAAVASGRLESVFLQLKQRALLQARYLVGTYLAHEIRLKRDMLRTEGVDETRSVATVAIGVPFALAEALVGLHVVDIRREVADRAYIARMNDRYRDLKTMNAEAEALALDTRALRAKVAAGDVPPVQLYEARRLGYAKMIEIGEHMDDMALARAAASGLRRAAAGLVRGGALALGGLLVFDAVRSTLTITIDPQNAAAAEAAWAKYANDADAALRDLG